MQAKKTGQIGYHLPAYPGALLNPHFLGYQKALTDWLKEKTKICGRRKCKYQDCKFAHSLDEIRPQKCLRYAVFLRCRKNCGLLHVEFPPHFFLRKPEKNKYEGFPLGELPLDVLHLILEYVATSFDDAQSIMLVCRKWRQYLLSKRGEIFPRAGIPIFDQKDLFILPDRTLHGIAKIRGMNRMTLQYYHLGAHLRTMVSMSSHKMRKSIEYRRTPRHTCKQQVIVLNELAGITIHYRYATDEFPSSPINLDDIPSQYLINKITCQNEECSSITTLGLEGEIVSFESTLLTDGTNNPYEVMRDQKFYFLDLDMKEQCFYDYKQNAIYVQGRRINPWEFRSRVYDSFTDYVHLWVTLQGAIM